MSGQKRGFDCPGAHQKLDNNLGGALPQPKACGLKSRGKPPPSGRRDDTGFEASLRWCEDIGTASQRRMPTRGDVLWMTLQMLTVELVEKVLAQNWITDFFPHFCVIPLLGSTIF